jgi:hypothetical protein
MRADQASGMMAKADDRLRVCKRGAIRVASGKRPLNALDLVADWIWHVAKGMKDAHLFSPVSGGVPHRAL